MSRIGYSIHITEVIPDTESRHVDSFEIVSDDGTSLIEIPLSHTFVGFVAVCSCDWFGPFREADDQGEGYSHDTAHRQATEDAEEHESRRG